MMGAGQGFHSLAQFSSEYMLECLAVGSGIALISAVLVRMLPRQNSGTRFAVWFLVLLAVALLPLFVGSGLPVSAHAPSLAAGTYFSLPASWALCLFAGWAMVAGALVLRVGIGLVQIRSLRTNSTAIDAAELPEAVQQALRESSRRVTICRSDRVRVPLAVGLCRPAVLLPNWLLNELSPDELHQVVVHELAHLRRWDDWTNLAQKLLRAFLFFHPAIWWIEQRVSLEREMACDDLVLADTGNAREYAACLAKLAERSLVRRSLALAQAAVSRIRHTTLRVQELLDGSHSHATRISRPAISAIGAVLLVSIVVLARQPELVSFSGGTHRTEPAAEVPAAHPATLASSVNEVVVAPPTLARASLKPVSTRRPAAPSKARALLANSTTPAPPRVLPAKASPHDGCSVTNAVFLVIETRRNSLDSPAMWQILVWRVTVVDRAALVPQKQT